MAERKLATTARIVSITPIEGADAIETARVRGWDVVVGKGEFTPGDLVAFFEIDTALPLNNPAFTKFGERSKKTLPDGTEVHVLRTIRLRGQISQGLIMSLDKLPLPDHIGNQEDIDLTDELGLQKWEPPAPSGSSTKGDFPTQFAQKTDSERVQNISDQTWADIQREEWIPTEKLDGTSVTIIQDGDNLIVCSRNYIVGEDSLHYGEVLKQPWLTYLRPGMVVQGEIVGPGINGNLLKLNNRRLFIFDIWSNGSILPRGLWPDWAWSYEAPMLDLNLPSTRDDAVSQANKLMSVVNPQVQAEGIVWHHREGKQLKPLYRSTWKAINNSYLLKNG